MPRSEDYVSAYELLLGGSYLDELVRKRIKEIRIVDNLRLPDVCSFEILYPGADGLDEHPFSIGKSLEVKLGARDDLTSTTLFKGEIVTLEPTFGSGSVALSVRAYDRSHHLHRSRRVRTFQNQTASDIVSKLAKEAGLTARCDASGAPYEFMQQDNETDWDFIWRLAERIGFEFLVQDEVAVFRRAGGDEAPVELEWPEALRSFSPRLTAVQQVREVSVFAHDPKTKQTLEGRASDPNQVAHIGIERSEIADAFSGATVHVATEPVKTQEEADALAQALLDRLANSYIAADGACRGNPRIRAGARVQVSGVGRQFSGVYRVATSTHLLRGGSTYETRFSNAAVNTMAGTVGGGNGVRFSADIVLGRVTNNNDPDGLGRVRVYYPALGRDHEGAWARVAVPAAGKERGLMMLPVPDEEVLVAFEHGDTTRPYVLGSLFNGRDTPGSELAATDGSFGLRSDKKLIMRAKEELEITSEKTMTVTIDGDVKEQFKATWEEKVDRDGTLKTGGKLTIEATGQLSIKGGPSVSLESSGSMKIKAAQLDIDGGAMVNIKGGMINLG